MEETKETFKILSKQDEIEFKKLATGRKFCKKGESIADICDEEIERYYYENSSNIFVQIFQSSKFRKRKENFMIERRTSSCIRSIAYKIIRNNRDNDFDRNEIIEKVKKVIMDKIENFEKENKIIDINTQVKKEA